MKLALIGDPVGHSESPKLHAEFLAETGMLGTYEAIRVPRGGCAAAIERLDGVRTAAVLPRQRHVAGSDASLCLVAYVAAQTGATLVPAVLPGPSKPETAHR